MCDKNNNQLQATLGVSSLIGTRPDQQDSVYGENYGDSLVAIICDGMGGLKGGSAASGTAVQVFAEDYEKRDTTVPIPKFLKKEAIRMDTAVHELQDEDGNSMKAGTTVAAVVITNSQMHWLTVGDSRVYVIRDGEINVMNQDHNYGLRLDRALADGKIDQATYDKEAVKAEALISYIGMGNVSMMDINETPYQLQKGDIIVVCSDGLYRSLSKEQIVEVLLTNGPDSQYMADQLTETAVINSLESQDNTSVAIVQYLGE